MVEPCHMHVQVMNSTCLVLTGSRWRQSCFLSISCSV